MRIGLDVHTLQGKYQGIRTYVAHLTRELTATASADDHVLLLGCNRETAARFATGEQWRSSEWWSHSPWIRIPFEAPVRSLADRLHVFHSQYICPPVSFTSEVVTIHDILFESHPEWFSPSFVRRSRLLYRMSARRAALVVTDSLHSKADLIHYYGLPPEHVVVVPLGVDHIPAEPPAAAELEGQERHLRLAGVPKGFNLCVGRIDPRKNLVRLGEAYRLLRARRVDVPPLVLVGPRDHDAETIMGALADGVRDGWLIELGSVDDGMLNTLFHTADSVIYPTLGEGFGLPVLEAMRVGAAVLTSPHPAIREFADDCVIYADPWSVESLAEGLFTMASLGVERIRLREAARERAARYTWRATAEQLWHVYRNAAA